MSLILSGTDGLSDIDGSAATPAIRGTDANTGIFFPAADTIAFSEGGVEAARFDSAGNLGLGVTPSAWASFTAIQIGETGCVASNAFSTTNTQTYLGNNTYYNAGGFRYIATGSAAAIYNIAANEHKWYSAAIGTAGDVITFTQAMTLDASGNLGVGITSPTAKTHIVQAVSGTSLKWSDNTYDTGSLDIINQAARISANNNLVFNTNGADRARIDSSGNLLVAKTSSAGTSLGAELKANGQVFSTCTGSTNASSSLELYSTGASAYRFYVGMGGTIFATSTVISAISDRRFKENIRDLDSGLAEVMALKPRLYDWKEGKGQNIKNARGFIAQEFETVFPDLIDEWKDPAPEGEDPYKSVRADLIPVLVKALQEQQALITQLQADVAALKGAA